MRRLAPQYTQGITVRVLQSYLKNNYGMYVRVERSWFILKAEILVIIQG